MAQRRWCLCGMWLPFLAALIPVFTRASCCVSGVFHGVYSRLPGLQEGSVQEFIVLASPQNSTLDLVSVVTSPLFTPLLLNPARIEDSQ